MKITVDAPAAPEWVYHSALRAALTFRDAYPDRPAGQRNCVIYAWSALPGPTLAVWWTAKRDITARLLGGEEALEALAEPVAE